MAAVGRYVKFTAREGHRDALAQQLLDVAQSFTGVPACELYLINRSPSEPDVVWVTEVWHSQEALDASLEALQTDAGRAKMSEVRALLSGRPERIDVEPLGGVGYRAR